MKQNIKIVALSDTHKKHKQIPIPPGDILIHAGDMTSLGNWYEFISVGNWMRNLKEQFKHRIMIAGNHDFGFEFNAKAILRDHFDRDIIYLQDTGIELAGLKFWGSPWVPQFYNWAFMDEDAVLERYWAQIPLDTNILITHGPPYGILDQESAPRRCGSMTLLNRIQQLTQLKHHIFGHIHEAYGQETIGGIQFHNVASLNGAYRYQNPPQVIEIEATLEPTVMRAG